MARTLNTQTPTAVQLFQGGLLGVGDVASSSGNFRQVWNGSLFIFSTGVSLTKTVRTSKFLLSTLEKVRQQI